MYKALSITALGIALSLLLAATTTASPARGNTARASQLDPPAAPSHLNTSKWYDHGENETTLAVNWRDNSTDEDGFILEMWRRNESNDWVLYQSVIWPANYTSTGFVITFIGRRSPYKFRVKAFNAAGDSAWSHWAH